VSLLSVPLVMGLPLGAHGAQAQSSPGGMMMAPAHSHIVIHNYPHTAVVGRAERFWALLPGRPHTRLIYNLHYPDGHAERIPERTDGHGYSSHTFRLRPYAARRVRETATVGIEDASGRVLAFTRFALESGGLHAHATRMPDTANPGISLTPSEGRVGSRAAVSGSGFVPHATITVTFDGSSVGTSCSTNANGSFSSCAFTVPGAAAGTHAVTASDGSTNSASAIYTNAAATSDTNPASGHFTNSGAPTSTSTPGIGLNPSSGAVGSTDAVGGSGFAPHSPITLTFDGARVNDPTTCMANATGSFDSCTFTIPAAIAGPHTVAASDRGHTNTAAASYNVEPAIDLNQTAGAVGSRAVVHGGGFAPNSPIALGFDDDRLATSCTSDAKGSFRCVFTVPEATAGSHTVTALDTTYINSAEATYTVDPAISLSSTNGTVGGSVGLSGRGFAPNKPITLTFDGNSIATSCVADVDGSFDSCTFIAPAVSAGTHAVTASDSSADSASAIYTITPDIGLIPSAGPVGSKAAVSGRGFAAGPITVTFDGSSVATSCTADATGSFNYCAFTVPVATAGAHTVTASDHSANSTLASYTYSATASYIVTPAISLNETGGAVDSAVTLSGSNFKPDSTITVTFDGTALTTSGTCTADAKGTLPASSNCAFTVPDAPAGTHTVAASDGTYSGSATYTVTPAISLSASAGAAGSRDVVSGSGFAANSPVALTFDGADVAMSCPADATGSFGPCVFTNPVATAGTHTVTASDTYGNSAAANYTITPAISLNPSAGAAGGTITLSGSNFKPNSTITVTYDGTALGTSGTCTADARGNLPASNNCAFTVPAAATGSSTVTASDGTDSGSATYTVTPAISLSASAGAVGSKATVNGSGFAPNDTIALTFDGASVPALCTTDAKGRFSSCAFAVPPASAGTHTVTASGSSVNAAWATFPSSAVAKYAVTPAISLSPSAGAAGSTAGVSGNGFAPYSTIGVTFDGSSVATSCVADLNGSFSSCTFTIPPAGAGSHTVRASDSSANSARATYTA
jgi:hypothetical protein